MADLFREQAERRAGAGRRLELSSVLSGGQSCEAAVTPDPT